MAGTRRSRIRHIALAGSLLVHVGLLWSLLQVERSSPVADREAPYLELAWMEASLEPAEAHAGAAAPPASLLEPTRRAARIAARPNASAAPLPAEAPAGAESAESLEPARVEPAGSGSDAAAGEALLRALDPRAVALSSSLAAECAEVEVRCGVGPADDLAAPGADLQAGLEEAARARPHVQRRPPPRVRRKLDGSYAYDGHVFRATIRPDGHVEFEDKAGGIAGTPIGFSFDLTDMVEKHILGKEIYAAEKRWFLEETRELRLRLEREDNDRVLARGLLRLRGKLIAIVEDAARTPAERRRAVFALWDDCADDEVGTRAQRAIEAFVRERMPQGSPLGFSEDELAALNLQRAGRRLFAPYRQT